MFYEFWCFWTKSDSSSASEADYSAYNKSYERALVPVHNDEFDSVDTESSFDTSQPVLFYKLYIQMSLCEYSLRKDLYSFLLWFTEYF